ncbi:hypothetical protein [Chiayiivirga flava]|uniref:Uncharacterized protein n=1 Tax=Chiayiivirga flava TaxID=659595 RepID=A0A7W8D5W0_9GAMM|nr:hypothetical protein [Chiayiivirga flava]MBB5208499.1 hypothetical protein [Chiayiivirga flava]
MKKLLVLLVSALVAGPVVAQGTTAAQGIGSADPAAAIAPSGTWKVWGGEIAFAWNFDLMRDLGIEIAAPKAMLDEGVDRMQRFALRDATGIDFAVKNGNFEGFVRGSLAMSGGYDLQIGKQTISLRDARLAVREDNPFQLDLVAADGRVWFYVDRLMYGLNRAGNTLDVQAMDLRVSGALADLLDDPGSEGMPVAGLRMQSYVVRGGFAGVTKGFGCGSSSKWPGDPVPGAPGQSYRADVFMNGFSMSYSRKDAQANGPGGTDGLVVYTPSSTLRNNNANGSATATIPGDPLGTSSSIWAADVPWRQKFSSNCEPYGNDQHPYLIWNLYRIDALGRIEQVGRSGVKHAFLTINVGCSENPGDGHILGRGCGDTYGTGNNDSQGDLGPRRELLPATGVWGRCGSIYDGNCNGSSDDFNGYSNFDHRLKVRESKIDPGEAANAGATYRFESWYIVRDDIDIYNTMQTRTATFAWNAGANRWDVGNGNPLTLGPAIDRWVAPGTADPNQRNTELVIGKARSKVAVKVTDLGGGTFRYDYAVMNFDYAHAVTEGSEPNLRVLSSDGFTAFSLPVSAALDVTDIEFSDGDTDSANDWTLVDEPNRITWTAPADNRLNWGTLFRFSITANAAPIEAPARLANAQVAPVQTFDALSLVPQSEAVQTFAVGGALSGLAPGGSISLRLNSGTPLVLDEDGAFAFANEVIEAGAYEVSIVTQPATQTCTVDNGSGTIAGADVTDVLVTCVDLPPPTYTVGGSVSGLGGGRTVSLQLDGGETLSDVANGPFGFTTLLGSGETYSVTVSDVPADRVCEVQNGSGTIDDADVVNVLVQCTAVPSYRIGGTVSGLDGSVGLQLNGGETIQRSVDGAFFFAGEVQSGQPYSVAITSEPAGQRCSVENGTGTVAGSDVTDIAVVCSARSTHTVGGTLSGLPAGRSIALRLNGGPALVLSSSPTFTFAQTLFDGAEYAVTISSAPAGLECTVENATGIIEGANVTDVAVTCREPGQVMPFVDGFE